MRLRTGSLIGALIAATVVVPGAPVAAQVPGPIDCPQVRPVDQVAPGDVGVGYTVARGSDPEPFDVEVIDILDDGIGPGIPLIVVEVDSPEIDRVGGGWAGMSGSPVYIGGELVGAYAYGFSSGPSKLGGLTPAAAMLEVPTRPTLPAPRSVRTSPEVQAHAAAEHGLSAAAASRMSPLPVPVRLAGPTGDRYDRLAAAFESAHPGTRVVRGGGTSAAAAPSDITAGSNLGVSLAYGDVTAIGMGTATTVCDGVVTGFGHPMLFEGATRLGMHGASTVRVVDDPAGTPYKLANATGPVGTIDHDRLAAVAGRLGVLPVTTPITSTVTSTDDSRTTTGRTDLVHPESVFDAVFTHVVTHFDVKAFDDQYVGGTADVAWTITGERADGTPFSVTRQDRHADMQDLSSQAAAGVAGAAHGIVSNPFEEVRLTGVDYTSTAGTPYRADRIVAARATVSVDAGPFAPASDGIEFEPGSTVQLRVPLQRHRGSLRTVDLALEVPEDAAGYGAITIQGGGEDAVDPFECVFAPEYCADESAEDLDALLAGIEDAPRQDELVASLVLYDEFDEGFEEPAPVATAVARVGEVVTGWAEFPAGASDPDEGEGEGEFLCEAGVTPPFIDVDPTSVHADAIACAADLTIAAGVSTDPPMYAPARAVSRAQVASFLVRVLDLVGAELPEAGRARFTDVRGSVHADSIERLAAAGIVRGRDASTFGPQDPVTRAQIATLLVETVRYVSGEPLLAEGPNPFPDVAGVHADNVTVATELGLVVGRGDGTFGPTGSTRRDQAASVLVRLLDLLVR